MTERQTSEERDHYLRLHGLNRLFPPALLPHIALCRFAEGETICAQGEPAKHLYVLAKGKIKVYNTSAEGKTLVVSFKSPLELIGDIEYVQNIDIMNTVKAVSPSVMLRVSYQSLKEYAGDHAPLLRFLLEIVTRKFWLKSRAMNLNLIYPVEVRLASYLLSVSPDETDGASSGTLHGADVADAADMIGTSYRHVNRVLRKFTDEGLIERKRDAVLIRDREKLREKAHYNIYEQDLERGTRI
ncbi:Crp/Fnr family transcriptional regulator [Paenibacillus sp.]|uniref:Crp/Fnr family transcriptional regulator n=1 Tax=Paenibacillus sp. TaxID=58172 RepID=UPI002D321E5E|nr:Crp/Fnr family transcriptional regulator [Paenibacillus sp.]HZG88543.1 Crp/Fnr family transcriptional regulator [Paenibacillus sp.]